MLFYEINPFVRQALSSQLTRQNRVDTYKRIKTVDSRLFYISSGSGKMTFPDGSIDLSAGTLVLFGAGTEYAWEVESVNYYAVNFDYTHGHSHIKRTFHPIDTEEFDPSDIIERAEFEDKPELSRPIVLYSVNDLEVSVKRIVTEYLMGGEYSRMLASAHMKELLTEVVKRNGEDVLAHDRKSRELVRRVIDYISNNYSKEIDYELLAEEFHFNPSYLNRVFREHTSSSIYNFLLRYRLNMAMEMLREQDIHVGEVAQLSGFQSAAHFTKAFKKQVGMSPLAYRKRYAFS